MTREEIEQYLTRNPTQSEIDEELAAIRKEQEEIENARDKYRKIDEKKAQDAAKIREEEQRKKNEVEADMADKRKEIDYQNIQRKYGWIGMEPLNVDGKKVVRNDSDWKRIDPKKESYNSADMEKIETLHGPGYWGRNKEGLFFVNPATNYASRFGP